MSETGPLFWLSLIAAGLAGSLHCVGMCGPILVGFAGAFRGDPGGPPQAAGHPRGGSLGIDFLAYHVGRIWTYALLGVFAGLAGSGLRHGSALLGWQRGAGVMMAATVLLSGLLLLGLVPGFDGRGSSCAVQRIRRIPMLGSLVAGSGFTARLLLGASMGLLPCGLVYAMLAVAAVQPTPFHAAAAMAAFGLGTLPALSAVLVAGRLIPHGIRRHGTRVAAILLVLAGVWMSVRALRPPHLHPAGEATNVPAATLQDHGATH